MVNRPCAARAAELAGATATLGVGLHVALTGGPPGATTTLPVDRVATLVNEQGLLPRHPDGLAHADPVEVEAEIEAQLARFEQLMGRPPTHLDSHHHSHRQPSVLGAMIRVAESHSLPVRSASSSVAVELERAAIATTDAFVEDFYGSRIDVESLGDILTRLPSGSVEIMCHPGYVDEILRASSSYVEAREKELRSLCSPAVRRIVSQQEIELIRFDDL